MPKEKTTSTRKSKARGVEKKKKGKTSYVTTSLERCPC